MRKYKLIALDIDGTLTVNRESTLLCMDTIGYLRRIEENGVKVSLVSSNALPIVAGLMKYLGLTGPAIGESGALIYFDGEIYHLTKYSAKQALEDVLDRYNEYVISSWQNLFRLYDYALKIRDEYRSRDKEIYHAIREYVNNKYEYLKVGYSGYAIHLTPVDVSKSRALHMILEKIEIEPDETVCIADSAMDVEFIRECGVGVAVSNADPELKKEANYITAKPSCKGVNEVLKKLFKLKH